MNKSHFYFLFLITANLKAASTSVVDGFIDVYYAYDKNRPSNHDRQFTTQAVRHNEANINLAYIGLTQQTDKINGRLALQAGTSVQSNYSSEPTIGSISGSTLSQHIQEAFLDFKITDNTSLIGGIYFSHIGSESFISQDNWTYTRSFAADFSPYTQSGFALKHKISNMFSSEFHVINGWQNISEDDYNKAVGFALRYGHNKFSMNYTNYLGHYQGRSRSFHDLNMQYDLNETFSFKALYDFGQQETILNKKKSFYTYNLQSQLRYISNHSITLRAENYQDPSEVNITTTQARGFRLNSFSINHDSTIDINSLIRVEFRQYNSVSSIFDTTKGAKRNSSLVALSLSSKF